MSGCGVRGAVNHRTRSLAFGAHDCSQKASLRYLSAPSQKTVAITPAGEEACKRYAQIREQLLVKSVLATGIDPARLSEIAAAMRSLSGQYDQAARAAASL